MITLPPCERYDALTTILDQYAAAGTVARPRLQSKHTGAMLDADAAVELVLGYYDAKMAAYARGFIEYDLGGRLGDQPRSIH